MFTRQQTISSCRAEAAKLIAVADSLEQITDEMYALMFSAGLPPGISSVGITPVISVAPQSMVTVDVTTTTIDEWGGKKRIVLEILTAKGKVMLKEDIVKEVERLTGAKDQEAPVTNALTALRIEYKVRGEKIGGIKIRGKFWGLAEWYDAKGRLKNEFNPYPQPTALADLLGE